MKFMKLGSRPDSFQADGKNSRYVASELASDITVNVGDIKFYLHKFPLLSKSARLQKLVADTIDGNKEEIDILDIPGGADSFEICAKFCYGMMVTLNPFNVASIRCAAEYLEMHETVEKGNLIYKIEVFLNSSILRAWKDSIIVLQSTKSLLPWSEDLKIVGRCIESISQKASMDTSKVEWSYTYNRESVSSEDGNELQWQGVTKQQSVPIDWWIHDISELQISYYKRVMTAIKGKGMVSNVIFGEALNAYVSKKLPSLNKSIFQGVDNGKAQAFIDTIIELLPSETGVVPCNLLLKLLKASILLDCGENGKNKLIKKIGQQLQDACASDLLIPAPVGGNMMYNVDIVICILKEFLAHDHHVHTRQSVADLLQEPKSPVHEASQAEIMVARLIDEYLAEIAVDPALPLPTFVNLAQMFRSTSRSSHDRLYRAIDMYLKEHAHLNKSDKKKICKLMDCKKLSLDACTHAVQNERLPLRIVVQVLFIQQMKANLPNGLHALIMQDEGGSRESSTTATTNTDDWYNGPLTGDINLLKADFNAVKLSGLNNQKNPYPTKIKNSNQSKGVPPSKKMFDKLWSIRDKVGNNSSSDTSESPSSSLNPDEIKSSP